ncbi:unnamed protein product [Microthlaspi erraticum]|uniref:Serine-threonine/tyrosine-protein kinase catalytic domain-containing protein n=1 Tax=Microthlaspi erraticum TaxID=1685480 RepID=A0A6D2J2B7_9BRAS|nr:unnamed protein product [Microthlaspi erraticum]
MKSDVYSFGVLVLEIISGKKTSSLDQTDGSPLELLDPAIGENYHSNEATRCIHIALLRVQEDHVDRPTLPSITLMLTSNTITLPLPQQPGFFFQSRPDQDFVAEGLGSSSTARSIHCSVNDASITDLEPR